MPDDATEPNSRSALGGWIDDTLQALSFLTRLPVSRLADVGTGLHDSALRAFPVAGAVVGALGGVALVLCLWLGVPALLSATLTVAVMVALTGAFHEDALADTADGFGGGWTVDEKLEIMRDSRLGSYGACALMLVIGTRIAAISHLVETSGGAAAAAAVIAGAALSRTHAVWLLKLLPAARSDGLSSTAGSPQSSVVRQAVISGVLIALVAAWYAAGAMPALTAVAASAIALWFVKRLAHSQIGGQTGDVAGAVQQVSECTLLVALVAAS